MQLDKHLVSAYSVSCTRHWTPKIRGMDGKFEKWALPLESTATSMTVGASCLGFDNVEQISSL